MKKETLEELKTRKILLEEELEVFDEKWDKKRFAPDANEEDFTWDKFCKARSPYDNPLSIVDKEIRLIETNFTMGSHKDYGDLFLMKDWVDCCRRGGFIDYDGFGHYSTLTEESSFEVYPSDVKANKVRKDFTHVMWYNR